MGSFCLDQQKNPGLLLLLLPECSRTGFRILGIDHGQGVTLIADHAVKTWVWCADRIICAHIQHMQNRSNRENYIQGCPFILRCFSPHAHRLRMRGKESG